MHPDPEPDAPRRLAPHPTLARYYRDENERRAFVRGAFDESAGDYDRVERMMAFGSGSWYRRRALLRSGLLPGARVLDVAMGTGLVAREASAVTGEGGRVVGLDPSVGMLRQAGRTLRTPGVLGIGEALPFRDGSFDFLSLGYALRHLADLMVAFREFHRVLATGGRVCVLEITPPRRAVGRIMLRLYVRGVVPLLARAAGGRKETALLWRYFWDTMDACVPPEQVLAALAAAGFANVARFVELGLFSEYTGCRSAT